MPVYRNEEVVGVLSATDNIDIFTDITNGNTILNGDGYVHLMNDQGEILVWSENTIVQEKIRTVYEAGFLSQEQKEEITEAFSAGQTMFCEFSYQGKRCHFYLEPIGINGWYLLCVHTVWGSSVILENMIGMATGVLLIFLILIIYLLGRGYRQYRDHNKELLKMAYEDMLTGADNIHRFDEKFCSLSEKTRDFTVTAINVHNFKGINELFGKAQGDRVLCYLKDMLETDLKQGEFFCRDAADLFYITLLSVEEKEVTERIEEIIEQVRQDSLMYGEYSYELMIYAGAAVQADREKALIALQSIQNTHHKKIRFYDTDLAEAVSKKNQMESCMYAALERQEFKLFLQPKFSLSESALSGAEALVRWERADGSMIYPNEFIPLFEKNGFCLQLDMYMFEKVCAQLREWIDQGIQPIPLSVNQSRILFSDRNYADNLMAIVQKYQISPSLITLEILESVATDDLNFLNFQIGVLHEKGFRISMDDFGSGYSSLNMLYQLRVDELKLDKGFLSQVNEEEQTRRQKILKQIISFAGELGISTVAEGVETEGDRVEMQALSCDYGQGYLFDRPMPAEEFTKKYM